MVKEPRSFSIWIATGLGAGYFPVAPGTAGSAVGLALVLALRQTSLGRAGLAVSLTALAGLLFAVGVWSAGKAEKYFDRKDPGQIVIDEVVGQMVTFLSEAHRARLTWKWLLAGFVLFRIFDIVKPPPARSLERLPGGWGITMDDCASGLYSLAALFVLRLWLSH